LASPYGFSESTREFLKELRTKLTNAGLEVLDPWEFGESLVKNFRLRSHAFSTKEKILELRKLNYEIGKMNHSAIDKASMMIACLDGSDVDSGTASEIGYAFGRGKRIYGYRGDFRLTGENEAASINIQVQYWIEQSGGTIVGTIQDLLNILDSVHKEATF